MSHYLTDLGSQFAKMVRESGFKPAAISRLLKVSKATISNYLSGKIDVPEGRVEALRLALAEQKGLKVVYPRSEEQVVGMETSDVRQTSEMLKDIQQDDPQGFEAVRQVIVHYHSRRPKNEAKPNTGVSSKVASVAAASAPGALRKALDEARSSSPSQTTAAHSENKAAPKSGTGRRSK